MGRTKVYRTAEERKQQKLRYRDAHNAKRREKYANDVEYRKSVFDANRARYREQHGVSARERDLDPKVASVLSVKRKVRVDGQSKMAACLTNEDLATAMGYHRFVLHRWQRSDRFPRPKHRMDNSSRQGVFLLPEAKELISIMRKHLKRKMYLTSRDTDTIAQLFAVVE